MTEEDIRRIEDAEDEREAQDYDARKAAGLLTPDEAEQIPFDQAVAEREADEDKR